MAEGIVESLEMIQVQHQDSQRLFGPRHAVHLAFQRFLQVAAIEEAGQRIANGLSAQGLAQTGVCDREPDLLRESADQQKLRFRYSMVPFRHLEMDNAKRLSVCQHRDADVRSGD